MGFIVEIEDDLFDQQAHDPLFGAGVGLDRVPDPRQVVGETQQGVTVDLRPCLELIVQPGNAPLQSGGTLELRRARGWRKPPDGVVVSRPSKWGNPFSVAEHGRAQAVELFRQDLLAHPELVAEARRTLRGRPLVCWCQLDQTCHADILLEVANGN